MLKPRRPLRDEIPFVLDIGPLLGHLRLPGQQSLAMVGSTGRWHLELWEIQTDSSFRPIGNIQEHRMGGIVIPGSVACCVAFARRREHALRWRMVCPVCHRLVDSLYAPNGLRRCTDDMYGGLQCRACVGLTYEQARWSHAARRSLALDEQLQDLREEEAEVREEERLRGWSERRRLWRRAGIYKK